MKQVSNWSSRLLPQALLIACVGLPLTACAQPRSVEDAAAPKADARVHGQDADKDIAHKADQATPAEAKQPKDAEAKTPEEIAKEKAGQELEKLQREASLRNARLAAELAPLHEKKQRIEAEISLMRTLQQEAEAKLADTQAAQKLAQQKADFENQQKVADIVRDLSLIQQQIQKQQVHMQVEELKQQQRTQALTADNAKLTAMVSALQAEINYINTKRSAASIDKDPMQYPKQPLTDGVLTISDRRIPLNDGIMFGTADYVTERIHYYNNLDDQAPIFIVIDRNPGGSVMEGYRIVTAMQNSKAPVHVVVKQYAASMAAVITTLAEESYAYPNAIILHHQMSSGMRGNLTQQKEHLEDGFKWAKRLANPVAKKMGVTYDQFTELMYKNNSDGDWAEFADQAVKLKWVNHVVEEIRETALVTAPAEPVAPLFLFEHGVPSQANAATPQAASQGAAMPRAFTQHELFNSPIQLKTKVDGNGKNYIELPALNPYDFYFLHDPTGRYRIAK